MISDAVFNECVMCVLGIVEQVEPNSERRHAIFKRDKVKNLFFAQLSARLSQLLTSWEPNQVSCNILPVSILINKLDVVTDRLVSRSTEHLYSVSHVKGEFNENCQESQYSINIDSVVEFGIYKLPELLPLILPAWMCTKEKSH